MAQDNLYDLIQSLSKSEKRYFTVHGGKNDSNHIRLFKLMSSIKEFDEKKLKKAFPKNLSWEKGNLYKLILKHMRNNQSDKSAYLELKKLITDAKFLTERGLFEQSLTLLKKAKKKAMAYHQLNDLLEINNLTRMNLEKIHSDGVIKLIKELIEDQKNILKNLNEEITYSNIDIALQVKFLQQITLSTAEEKKALAEEYSFLYDAEVTDIQSIRGQYHYLNAKKNLAQLLGQHQIVYDLCDKIVKWWNKHPEIREVEKRRYLGNLANSISACSYVGYYEKIPAILQQIESQKPNNLMEEVFIFRTLLRYKVLYLINTGAFNEAKATFLKSEKSFSKFELDAKWKTSMIVNFAIVLFILHDFRDCIYWIDQILENKNVETRQKAQQFARILKCICYLELEDIEGFESAYRSANNFFTEMKLEKGKFEFTVLRYLKRIETSTADLQKIEQKALFDYLKNEQKSPNNKLLIGLQECLLWIESKIDGITIQQLYRRKLGRED